MTPSCPVLIVLVGRPKIQVDANIQIPASPNKKSKWFGTSLGRGSDKELTIGSSSPMRWIRSRSPRQTKSLRRAVTPQRRSASIPRKSSTLKIWSLGRNNCKMLRRLLEGTEKNNQLRPGPHVSFPAPSEEELESSPPKEECHMGSCRGACNDWNSITTASSQ